MIEALNVSFEVTCSAEHAFTVWTSRIGSWWPRDHTVTQQPGLDVILESGVGGRIYERTAEGAEHEWGQVTVWSPPERLAYRWHLGMDGGGFTEVDIRFHAQEEHTTRIQIEHRGWEALGAAGADWRGRNQVGWQAVLPHYLSAITEGAT